MKQMPVVLENSFKWLCFFGLVLIVSWLIILFSMPLLSRVTYNDASNLKAELKSNEAGRQYFVADFDSSNEVAQFYELINLPLSFDVWWFLLIIGLVLLFWMVAYSMEDCWDHGIDKDKIVPYVLAALVVQLIAFASLAFWSVHLHGSFGMDDNIRLANLGDEELADYIIRQWHTETIEVYALVLVFALVAEVVLSVISLLLITGFCYGRDAFKEFLITKIKTSSGFTPEEVSGKNLTILIGPSGTVKVVRLRSKIKWLLGFIPTVVMNKESVSNMTLDDFFQIMAKGSKESAFEEVKNGLEESCVQHIKANIGETPQKLVKNIYGNFREGVVSIIDQTNPSTNESLAAAAGLLVGNGEGFLKRYQQDLLAKIREAIETIAAEIKDVMSLPLLEAFDQAQAEINDGLEIQAYPEGTRFLVSNHETQVIVIEQKPQVRNIHLTGDLIDVYGGKSEFRKDCYASNGKVDLAFPYTVFVISLQGGKFNRLGVFYSNKPVTTMRNKLARCNLPNTYDNGQVCLNFKGFRETTLAGKVHEVIEHFWNSRFNTQLMESFNASAGHNKEVSNFEKWHAASMEDPLFGLKIKWAQSKFSLSQLINEEISNSTDKRLGKFRAVVDAELEKLQTAVAAKVTEVCQELETTGQYGPATTKLLAKYLDGVVQDTLAEIRQSAEVNTQSTDELSKVAQKLVEDSLSQSLNGEFERLTDEIPLKLLFPPNSIMELVNR